MSAEPDYTGTRIMIVTEAGQILGWYVGRKTAGDLEREGGLLTPGNYLRHRRSKDGARSFLVAETWRSPEVLDSPGFLRFEGFH